MTGTFGEADYTYGSAGTFGALETEAPSDGQGFGDCTFGSGTFGEPCVEPAPGVDLINIIETDGRIFQLPLEQPYSFIADTGQIPIGRRANLRTPMIGQTGIRVRMRFIQADEGLPTYTGLTASHDLYSDVLTDYDTYHDLITDPDLAHNIDYDITCFVAGITIKRGRNGLFDDIDAGTCSITLIDQLGLFDPRWEDTLLGPGRRIRTGTWVRIELHRAGEWVSLWTGLTDRWERNITPEQDMTVEISGTDFFTGLATAHVSGPLIQETSGQRIQSLLINYWQTTWGNWTVPVGTNPLYAQTIEDDVALDLIRAAAQVDDGRIYIDADGNFIYETADWRNTLSNKALVLGRGATDFLTGELSVCTYDRIKFGDANYTALLDTFLVYDDMAICTGDGTMPIVCGGYFTSADIADDVANEIVIEYQPAEEGDSVFFTATDSESILRYGKRGFTRSDLTPVDPGVLNDLAHTLLARWKSGDATVTQIGVDLLREGLGTNVLIGLQSGDRIVTVDEIPSAVGAPERWALSTSEVMSVEWNLGPTQFTLTLTLDQLRTGRPTTEPETEGAFLHDLDTDRTATPALT